MALKKTTTRRQQDPLSQGPPRQIPEKGPLAARKGTRSARLHAKLIKRRGAGPISFESPTARRPRKNRTTHTQLRESRTRDMATRSKSGRPGVGRWTDRALVEYDCAGDGRRPGPRTAPRATSDLQTSVLQPDTDRGIAALEPGLWTIVLSCGRDHAKRVYRSDSRQIFDAVRCDLAFLNERTWIPPNLPTYSLNRHDRIWFSLLTCPDRSSVPQPPGASRKIRLPWSAINASRTASHTAH